MWGGANSEGLDEMLQNAAFLQGLHCLPEAKTIFIERNTIVLPMTPQYMQWTYLKFQALWNIPLSYKGLKHERESKKSNQNSPYKASGLKVKLADQCFSYTQQIHIYS